MAVVVHLLGHSDYRAVHDLQKQLLMGRIAGELPDVILLLEHAEVITVGRARDARDNVLDAGDVPVVEVERGGHALSSISRSPTRTALGTSSVDRTM